jgi:uncharacterized protein (TIGR02246 family)
MRYLAGILIVGACAALLAAPEPVVPGTAIEREIIALEHEWKQAVVDRDAARLNALYAEEYLSTDPEGMVWNKAEDIEIDTAGVFHLKSFTLDDLKVRAYGDVAVVTGQAVNTGLHEGLELKGYYRFTDVFAKRDGRWVLVANHLSNLAPTAFHMH